MRINFWGVRGSLPSPLLPAQIKSKISAIIERLTPEDLASEESRERFMAGLPPWLFGAVGGNTPCLTIRADNPSEVLVFDAGSGIRELGNAMLREQPRPSRYRVFFSHFHWDHIQGLPFFGPAYDPSVNVDFYSPVAEIEQIIQDQMRPPVFPVRMESMGSRRAFHVLGGPVTFDGLTITYKTMNHPGGCYSYLVDDGNHRFIYATDTELTAADFSKDEENSLFFQDVDLIVIDCQYTLGEAIEKYNWGHNAFSMAADFAANWGIKHMVLFHHEPTYSDHKIYNMLQSASWYLERMNIKGIELSLAVEGLEIKL
ncbi:MAG: MBL fold metallo-hydrolase [Treponema sp.]|jgi:phosphoribosyl 1,2-cyclic phosphodiesterase|nr:MBL fold metallo-hydrolase [Treponema sp.]